MVAEGGQAAAAMSDVPKTRVDTVLARYPGPVRLYLSRLKRVLMIAIGAPVAAFCAWLLLAGHVRLSEPGGMAIIIGIIIVWAGGSAIAGAVMLRKPGIGYITLDADGFETSGLYGNVVRARWRDVSAFELRDRPMSVGTIDLIAMYDVPNAPPGKPGWGMLPDNYGLSEGEIVWLMNEWRARALGRPK